MNLKELSAADQDDVFFDPEGFAGMHTIDGVEMVATVTEEGSKIRSNDQSEQFDGIFSSIVTLKVKKEQFLRRPVYGQSMNLDGKPYMVQSCTGNMNRFIIILAANDS